MEHNLFLLQALLFPLRLKLRDPFKSSALESGQIGTSRPFNVSFFLMPQQSVFAVPVNAPLAISI